MKISGYGLREAIKQHELRRDTAAGSFNGALMKWPGETKDTPQEVVTAFLEGEAAIAQLQTAQMRYNLAVTIEHEGQTLTLAEGIKRLGGLARAEKMWRSVATPKAERYGSPMDARERSEGVVTTVPTVSTSEAVRLAQKAAKVAGALRAQIATANAVLVELDLSPTLLA